MDDEDEVEGLLISYAIEDQHRLHSKMPGTGTIGRGHDDGNAAYNEGDKSTRQAKVLREVEAEEGEIVMQEIAEPDANSHHNEKRHAAHTTERGDTLPDATQRGLHLIIYREAAQQHPQQNAHSHQADSGDKPSCPREAAEDAREIRASLAEEGAEGAHLYQQRQSDDEQHQQHIDDTLGDHRAQGFRERDALPALQHTATCELADTGNDQRGGIAEEDAVGYDAISRLLAQRLQRLLPAPSTYSHRQNAKGKRQQHPRPVHLVEHHLAHPLEVEAAIHPVKDGATQQQGQHYLHHVAHRAFLVHHACKVTTNY